MNMQKNLDERQLNRSRSIVALLFQKVKYIYSKKKKKKKKKRKKKEEKKKKRSEKSVLGKVLPVEL